jgi:hypothetical protein
MCLLRDGFDPVTDETTATVNWISATAEQLSTTPRPLAPVPGTGDFEWNAHNLVGYQFWYTTPLKFHIGNDPGAILSISGVGGSGFIHYSYTSKTGATYIPDTASTVVPNNGGFYLRVSLKNGRLVIAQDDVLVVDVQIPVFGGFFTPTVSVTTTPSPGDATYNPSYGVTQPRRYIPSHQDAFFYDPTQTTNEFDGNGQNHMTARGVGTVYGLTLDRTRFTADAGSGGAGGPFLPISGGTILGPLGLGSNTVAQTFYIGGPAGSFRNFFWLSGGNTRWGLGVDNANEAGGNAGSDFNLTAFDDLGNQLGAPVFHITRSNGFLTIGGGASVTAGLSVGAALGVIGNITCGWNAAGHQGFMFNAGSNFQILSYADNGAPLATPLKIDRATAKVTLARLNLSGLPTSATGLVAGDVWRNGNVLNIV